MRAEPFGKPKIQIVAGRDNPYLVQKKLSEIKP